MEKITFEQAIDVLTANSHEISDVEEVFLLKSLGNVAAQDYFATFDNPPFNRSPLDGYALKSSDTITPKPLKVIGEECAGDFFSGEIKSGEALRIMTGAAMPKGADCVIRQENVTFDGENIIFNQKLAPYENFCFAGEDIKAGSLLVAKNTKITAAHVAILASQGVNSVKIYRKSVVAVASTGDELIKPGEKLTSGKIFNSNLYLIASRLLEMGFEPKILGNFPDDDSFAEKIFNLRNEIDLLITTGGVSVGKKDIMHDVVKKIGEKLFWRVQIKPGAPVIGWKCENFLGLSLSGNPFAAFATFELLARPVLAKISRRADVLYEKSHGILADDFPKKSLVRRFIRAKFDGERIFLPKNHESGTFYSAVDCNCLVDIPAGSDALKTGNEVEIILL